MVAKKEMALRLLSFLCVKLFCFAVAVGLVFFSLSCTTSVKVSRFNKDTVIAEGKHTKFKVHFKPDEERKSTVVSGETNASVLFGVFDNDDLEKVKDTEDSCHVSVITIMEQTKSKIA